MAIVCLYAAAAWANEAAVREALAGSGPVTLPAGTHDIHAEIPVRASVVRGAVRGTTLRAANDFRGRALLTVRGAAGMQIENVTFDGNRAALEKRSGFPPSSKTFAEFTQANALLVEESSGITLSALRFREVAGFAVLVRASRGVTIHGAAVSDSGSRLPSGANNGTGGVLLEDGTTGFTVENSTFVRILGNAVWTHSRLNSPRNARGVIRHNRFDTIGRDAIQVGHAMQVRVEENTIERVGYPHETVDIAGGGIPVGIDTAGNVSESSYVRNTMREMNGKCIDLDGFHHGEVAYNNCRNTGAAADYPSGHYAIVFNNNNPQMRSEKVHVHDNAIEGMKFGGVFLLGRDHRVERNRFLSLNRAGCPESHAQFQCLYFAGQPEILSSGIYLGVSAAESSRQEPATGNVIVDNIITGHGMKERCVASAPGVAANANTVARNQCREAQ